MADAQIEITCPGCERQFQVPSDEQGRIAECPSCQGWVDIPEVEQPEFNVPIVTEGLPIEVDGLILRSIEYRDCGDLHEIYSNPECMRYEFEGPWTAKENEQELTWKLKQHATAPDVSYFLVAEHLLDDKVIAESDLEIISRLGRQGQISFVMNSSYQDQGLETKIMNAVLDFGFGHLNLHRIIAYADTRDERLWRLMERVGMRREGCLVHNGFSNNEWCDDYIYAILENNWRARSNE